MSEEKKTYKSAEQQPNTALQKNATAKLSQVASVSPDEEARLSKLVQNSAEVLLRYIRQLEMTDHRDYNVAQELRTRLAALLAEGK